MILHRPSLARRVSPHSVADAGRRTEPAEPAAEIWPVSGAGHFNVAHFFDGRRAQRVITGVDMSNLGFNLRIEMDVDLDIASLWPDGDAPERPTAADVAALVKKDGGLRSIINDWALDQYLVLTIARLDDKGDVAEVIAP